MKKLSIVLLTILLISIVSSSTYAWLTYVQRKSLASVETHSITIIMQSDETIVSDALSFTDLAFIDYDLDLIQDQTGMLSEMASVQHLRISTSSDSPLSKNHLAFSPTDPGLIYVLLFQGYNTDTPLNTMDYHELVNSIITGYITKEEQLLAIEQYNQTVIQTIDQLIFKPEDYIRLDIIAWGDYDSLVDPIHYQTMTFDLAFTVESINSKGEVSS